jgi:hypothetical protein
MPSWNEHRTVIYRGFGVKGRKPRMNNSRSLN